MTFSTDLHLAWATIASKSALLATKDAEIARLKEDISAKDAEMLFAQEFCVKIAERRLSDLADKDAQIVTLKQSSEILAEKLECLRHVRERNVALANIESKRLWDEVRAKSAEVEILTKRFHEKDAEIAELKGRFGNYEDSVVKRVNDTNAEIAALKDEINDKATALTLAECELAEIKKTGRYSLGDVDEAYRAGAETNLKTLNKLAQKVAERDAQIEMATEHSKSCLQEIETLNREISYIVGGGKNALRDALCNASIEDVQNEMASAGWRWSLITNDEYEGLKSDLKNAQKAYHKAVGTPDFLY